MRRNVIPVQNRHLSSQTRRDILNHLNKIRTIIDASSRNTIQKIKPNIQKTQDSSDDDYFDDYIMNESSSESDSETQQLDELSLRKKNRERSATETQIKSLGRVKVQTNLQGICAICLDEWKIKQLFNILPCTHRFHQNCIKDWLSQKNSCPCCNLAVF